MIATGLACHLRPERASDVAAIDAVTQAAFLHAPHSQQTEHRIVAALRADRALAVSLVAEHEGAVIGHIAASPVTITDGSPGWFGIGPVSVLPAFQGRGVGSQLMRAVLQQLGEHEARGAVLLGEPAFYSRFGFRAVPGLQLPDVPAEFFMALSLCSADTPWPQGSVAYHPAFWLAPAQA